MKKEYKEWMDDLQPKLSYLQRACKEQKIPVMIVFEGFGAAGKGTLINKIIEPLDPRGFSVYYSRNIEVHSTDLDTGCNRE